MGISLVLQRKINEKINGNFRTVPGGLHLGQCLLRVKRHAGECLSDLASGLSFSAGGYHYDSGLYPENEKMSIRTLKRGIIMGIVLYFEFLFFTVGLQYTTSSKSSFIIGSYVAILPLIYWVIRGKKPQRADILAALVCIVGLGFILLGSFDGVNKGDLISLLSAVCYAIHIVVTGIFCKGRGRLSVKYASDWNGRHFGTCGGDDPGATSGAHVRHEHRKHRLSGSLLHGCAVFAQCVWTEICENFHKRRDPFF